MNGGSPRPRSHPRGERSRPPRSLGVAASLLLASLLAACAPDRPYDGPTFPFRDRFQGAAGSPVLLSNDLWWRDLDDPALDRLVALALDGNPSVAAAQARLASAAALVEAVGTGASGSGGVGASIDGEGEAALTFDLSLSRVFDPGGALRAERRGARAGADIARAELDAARLRLLAAVVDGTLDLRFRQRALALRQEELGGRRATLAAARTLAEAGAATRLDTLRAEARVADIEAELPGLEAEAAAAASALAVLAGRAPGGLPPDLAGALAAPAPQPRATLAPEVGIPADLLRNRPDLALAERRYYAAVVAIDAARAALYPRLSLRGSLSVDALGDGAAALVLGPSLQLPALPQGPARAGIAAREAAARAAAEDWRGAVLGALGEVEAALIEYRGAARSEAAAARAARLNREALDLTRRLFDREAATLGEVTDAESGLAQAEARLAELTLRRARAFAALNVSLGAGHATGGSGGELGGDPAGLRPASADRGSSGASSSQAP